MCLDNTVAAIVGPVNSGHRKVAFAWDNNWLLWRGALQYRDLTQVPLYKIRFILSTFILYIDKLKWNNKIPPHPKPFSMKTTARLASIHLLSGMAHWPLSIPTEPSFISPTDERKWRVKAHHRYFNT